MTTIEHRKTERIPERLPIQLEGASAAKLAFSRNLSVGGICIESAAPAARGEKVRMTIRISPSSSASTLEIEGVVHWIGQVQHIGGSESNFLMGIEFDPLDQLQQMMLEERIRNFREKRAHERYYEHFEIIMESLESLELASTENIGRGGLFIDTAYIPPLDAGISLWLLWRNRDEKKELRLCGKVIYTVHGEKGNRIGAASGFGLELADFPNHKEKAEFEDFIALLKMMNSSITLVG